jgi:hypothetical protein
VIPCVTATSGFGKETPTEPLSGAIDIYWNPGDIPQFVGWQRGEGFFDVKSLKECFA